MIWVYLLAVVALVAAIVVAFALRAASDTDDAFGYDENQPPFRRHGGRE